MGWHAINDSVAGPSTPGTAYVLLHDHAAEQAGGGLRTWGFVRGGIGLVTEAMADAAARRAPRSAPAEVERVVVAEGRATGVRARRRVGDRGAIASSPTPIHCAPSSASSARTCLPDRFNAALRNYRCEGTSVKINLAVDRLPEVSRCPAGARALPRRDHGVRRLRRRDGPRPVRGQVGRLGSDPHVEVCIPTFHDPSLAPEGNTC